MSYYPPGVTGAEPYLTGEPEPVECERCEGMGVLLVREEDGSRTEEECPRCEGAGVITPEAPEPEWEPPEERG